jgi:hypothetical protein
MSVFINNTNTDNASSVWAYRALLQKPPLIQFGSNVLGGTGASGNFVVNIPIAYSSTLSYAAFASMRDSPAANIACTQTSPSQFTIYWSQGGSGTQYFSWSTIGT